MSLSFMALWLLCAAASVTFAALRKLDLWLIIGLATGFILGVWLTPQPEWLGLSIGCLAFFTLLRERRSLITLTAGFLGGIGGHVLNADGLSLAALAILGVGLTLYSSRLSGCPDFTPPRLREQGLCLLVFASPVVAGLRVLNSRCGDCDRVSKWLMRSGLRRGPLSGALLYSSDVARRERYILQRAMRLAEPRAVAFAMSLAT